MKQSKIIRTMVAFGFAIGTFALFSWIIFRVVFPKGAPESAGTRLQITRSVTTLQATLKNQFQPVTQGPVVMEAAVAFLPSERTLQRNYKLIVLSEYNGTMEVTGPAISRYHIISTIRPGKNRIDLEDIAPLEGTSMKGLIVRSDVEVTVLGDISNGQSSQSNEDSFLAFPTQILSNEYVVVSYEPRSGYKSQFLILAIKDNTHIKIQFRLFKNFDSIELELQKHGSYLYQHDHDLTGTLIKSTNDIAVFAGASMASVPYSVNYLEALESLQEQVLPTRLWRSQYIVPRLRSPYLMRIVAKEENTSLIVHSKYGIINTTLAHAGDLYDMEEHGAVTVTSSSPVTVVQFIVSSHLAKKYPSMCFVFPTELYLSAYKFHCKNIKFSDRLCFISIVIPKESVDGLLLDKRAVTLSSQIQTTIPPPFNNYSSILLEVGSGIHYLTQSDGVLFGASVFNDGQRDSFGYPCGVKYAP